MATNSADTTAKEPVHISSQSELEATVEEYDLVLVDFYADWCGPCKMIEPTLETLAEETVLTVAKVDVDANQLLAQQHGVQGVPTLKLYADGEQTETLVGLQSEEQLRSLIDQYN